MEVICDNELAYTMYCRDSITSCEDPVAKSMLSDIITTYFGIDKITHPMNSDFVRDSGSEV